MKMKHIRDHTRKIKNQQQALIKNKLKESGLSPEKLFEIASKSIEQTGCEVCNSFNIRHHSEYQWFCCDCNSIILPKSIINLIF